MSWLGAAGDDDFHLISPMPRHRLHAQFAFEDATQRVLISPRDAERLGISDDDLVRVWNDRGECECAAEVTTSVRPRVLSIENGRWLPTPDPSTGRVAGHGNPNTVTSDRATSPWGQATAAHSCLVRIEPARPSR